VGNNIRNQINSTSEKRHCRKYAGCKNSQGFQHKPLQLTMGTYPTKADRKDNPFKLFGHVSPFTFIFGSSVSVV
jgi:hypothetical protein